MKVYKFLYLFWLIPGYLLFLSGHQAWVYRSVVDTYDNGTSYLADVEDFNLKQIAAQNSAYVILKFETNEGEQHTQKLSLPFEMVKMVGESSIVPIRYKEGDFVNIVIITAYGTQKRLALMNLGIALVGFLITLAIAWFVHLYARRKVNEEDEQFVIERVDHE